MQISPSNAAVSTTQNANIETKSHAVNISGAASQSATNHDAISMDTASLSSGSALLSLAIGMNDASSPKVGLIVTALSKGTYRIDENHLATTLMQSMLQNGGAKWKS